MSRSETKIDQQFSRREGGKTWDTLKPLSENGLDLTSTLLIDDSPHKIFPGEERNVILLKEYDGGDESAPVLETLVDHLITMAANARDVRLVAPALQKSLDDVTGRKAAPPAPAPVAAPPTPAMWTPPAPASGSNADPLMGMYPMSGLPHAGAMRPAAPGVGIGQFNPMGAAPGMGGLGNMGHGGIGMVDNGMMGGHQMGHGGMGYEYPDMNHAFQSFWQQSDMHVLMLQYVRNPNDEELKAVDMEQIRGLEPNVHLHLVALMRAAMVVLLTAPKGVPEAELWDIVLLEQNNNPFRQIPTKTRVAQSKGIFQGLIAAGGIAVMEMSWMWSTLQPCYTTVPGYVPRNEMEHYLLTVLQLLEELDGVAVSQLMCFLQGLHPLLAAYFPTEAGSELQKMLAVNTAASYFKVPPTWEAQIQLTRKKLKTFLCIKNPVIDLQPLQESIEVLVGCHESVLGRAPKQAKKKQKKGNTPAVGGASVSPGMATVGDGYTYGAAMPTDSGASWEMDPNDDVVMDDSAGMLFPVQTGASNVRLCPDSLEEASCLHSEVLEFAAACLPQEEHMANVMAALTVIERAAKTIWPEAQAVVFGSQATGLALPSSDLDVVLLGVANYELKTPAEGFSKAERGDLVRLLQNLTKALRASGSLRNTTLISRARIPIVKCALNIGPGVAADISIGTRNGAQAVLFLQQLVRELPPLRPLCLIVKALLKEQKLNEVFKGGLSSWSLVNMVVAHLQCEGFQISRALPLANGPLCPFPVQELRALRGRDLGAVDLAWLLWSFFERYGNNFDYMNDAVSIMEGGVRQKDPSWVSKNGKKFKLCVEDPQQQGRDIAAGTHEIQKVVLAFREAAMAVAPYLVPESQAPPMPNGGVSWAAVQADSTHQSVQAGGAYKSWRMNVIVDVCSALEHDEDVHEQRLQDHCPPQAAKTKKKKNKKAKQAGGGWQAAAPGHTGRVMSAGVSPGASLQYASGDVMLIGAAVQPAIGGHSGAYGLGVRGGGVQKQSGYPQAGYGAGGAVQGAKKKKNKKKKNKQGGPQGPSVMTPAQHAGGAPLQWRGF